MSKGSVTGASEATERTPQGVPRSDIGSRVLGRLPMDARCLMVIAATVLLANLLYLTGIFDPNPLATRSGLGHDVLAGLLPGQSTIDPNSGFVSQALSHRAALDLFHLQLPWWNPFEGTGAPLLGETQAAGLFPLTLLTSLANGQLYEHILLEIVAGVSTYFLLRRLAVGRAASLGGGIAFALNGTFAWFAHAAVNPVALLPALVLGLELAYSASLAGRHGGWWLIAVTGALSVYSGFPEVTYLTGLFCLLWFAVRLATLDRVRASSFLLKALLGALVAVLLAAPQLIAMIDYLGHANLGLNSHGILSHEHIPIQTAPQLVMPYVFGPIFAFTDAKFQVFVAWENLGGFLSSSLLFLALLGLFATGQRRGLRIALGLWLVVMLTRTYGTPPFVTDLLNVLPGLSNVAVARYAWPTIELATIVLAAIGLDGLVRGELSRRAVLGTGLGSVGLVAGATGAAWPLAHQLGSGLSRRGPFVGSVIWAVVVVLALAAAALMLPHARSRGRVAVAIMILDALLLFVIPELSAPRAAPIDTAPVSYLKRHLGTGRYFTLGPLAPNYGSYFGLASLNANDVPIPSVFARYVDSNLDPGVNPTAFVGTSTGGRSPYLPSPEQALWTNLAGYRRAGVSYVLTPAGQALPESPSTFTLVDRTPTTWIYHLAGAATYMTSDPSGCTISIASRTAARLSCPRPAMLVRRETDIPGWTATVDGRATPVRSFDRVFQAVRVPAGTHEVHFGFVPPAETWGAVAFLLGAAALLLARARRTWA